MAERYKKLEGNLYYDTKDRVIVKNMGGRYVYVRHDRRVRNSAVSEEKRTVEKIMKDMIRLPEGLFFSKKDKQIYKKSGDNFVLYAKDRRKAHTPVDRERRTM
ncbi:MAG TPA: hypothetical protein P5511_02610 [Candidatus Goldiibacteriota bacterium]|nr:hypothetical protein [Candidatus Goldiibacteriota bacterium]